jgi:PAS domain S-box-containing protein
MLLAKEDAGGLLTDSLHRRSAPIPFRPGDDPAARFAFLAAAGELLSSSLDYEQTLQHLARLAVPVLGDLCIVDVIEEDQLRRVATAHRNPVKTGLLDQLCQQYPATMNSPQPAGRVARTGQAELLAEVTPDVVASRTRDPQHAELITAIGIRSHMAVPLVARGAILGVISLGITESARRYGAADLALAQDLARLAALAVDNARLYRRAQEDLAERRRAEDALRVSEGRFRAVMEQSPLSTQIFDASGVPLRVNRAWQDLWGTTLENIPEYNILHDPQLEQRGIAPLIRRAFAGETVELPAVRYDPDETLKHRSSHADPVRWVRAFAYPVKDDRGTVREVVLVHEDVTLERKAGEQLRASEERLRLALAAGRMNVWDWDLLTDRVECSDNARGFWGIDAGQAEDFTPLIHPEDQRSVAEAAAAARSSGREYASEYRLQAATGVTRWVQSRGHVERDASGHPVRIRGVTVDITDLKVAEETTRILADAGETLGASLDYHETLRRLAEVLVPRLADWYAVDLLTDSGGLEREYVHHPDPSRVAYANELFTRYPPRRSDPFGAWHVLATRQPESATDITDGVLQAVAHSPEHLDLLRALDLRSYLSVPLIARGAPIGVLTLVYAESGRRYHAADVELMEEVARRIAVAVDNARLYQQLRTEDRRKDEFLATLAHELRNPLAPIRTGLALLRAAPDAG